jgi:ribosomal protein S18 acetylase RimI-like enzyme
MSEFHRAMPVILEVINQPDAADLADLERIYADYPLPPVASFTDWLFDQRTAGKTLIAGRFNGSLLGALWLHNERIEHLCVRAVTRRRGTARQLLQLLQSHAALLQLSSLQVADTDQTLAALWQQLGFTRSDSGWLWRR